VRFWTSDNHFGHDNIITFCSRPFTDPVAITGYDDEELETDLVAPNVDLMNNEMVRLWNEKVGPEDEVVIVGDFALGRIETTVQFAYELNGTKFLVPGNHDRCHPMYPPHKQKIEMYEEVGFTILDTVWYTEIGGTEVRVCHFPYTFGSHGFDDKFSGLRPDDDGMILLHGHTHESEQISGPHQIHVGVDAWDYQPASEDEIIALMEMMR
jgi:calcineurin-like phosphoesterase family protein